MADNNSSPVLKTPFLVMVRNLVVVYAAFLLCHPVFIWYNWSYFKGNLSGMFWPMLKGSLVFDTAGIMYICAVYMVLILFPLHFKEKALRSITCCFHDGPLPNVRSGSPPPNPNSMMTGRCCLPSG